MVDVNLSIPSSLAKRSQTRENQFVGASYFAQFASQMKFPTEFSIPHEWVEIGREIFPAMFFDLYRSEPSSNRVQISNKM